MDWIKNCKSLQCGSLEHKLHFNYKHVNTPSTRLGIKIAQTMTSNKLSHYETTTNLKLAGVFPLWGPATRELHQTRNCPLMLQTRGCWKWQAACMEQFWFLHQTGSSSGGGGSESQSQSPQQKDVNTTCRNMSFQCANEHVGHHSRVQFSKTLGFPCSTQKPPPLQYPDNTIESAQSAGTAKTNTLITSSREVWRLKEGERNQRMAQCFSSFCKFS